MTFIEILNNPESRKLVDIAEEYQSDLRDQPGRTEHIEGLRSIAKEILKLTGFTIDISEEEENFKNA